MKRFLTVIAAALAFSAVTEAWAASNSKRVLITFKAGTSKARRQKALEALGATSSSAILSNEGSESEKKFVAVVAKIPAGAAPTGAAAGSAPDFSMLSEGGDRGGANGVVKIEEDFRDKWIESGPVSFQATPFLLNGATLGQLGLQKFTRVAADSFNAAVAAVIVGPRSRTPWGVLRVNAPAAWDYTEGAGVSVAVIDTGIDLSHPDLQGRVVGGYNAVTDSDGMDSEGASYQDDNGHGTHVAGVIAANGAKLVGVAPKARLYAVKVLSADGGGNLSDIIKGVIWCANNSIQVANMSLGSRTPSESLHRAVMYAKSRGVVIVAAAGNSSEDGVTYPGAYKDEVITVSASDAANRIASFSSRGPEVKFIAPGVDIFSSMLGGDYASLSGTSMAAPHVAGLAALVVSLNYRGLSGPDGVLAQLRKLAKPLSGLGPNEQGYGMLDGSRLRN